MLSRDPDWPSLHARLAVAQRVYGVGLPEGTDLELLGRSWMRIVGELFGDARARTRLRCCRRTVVSRFPATPLPLLVPGRACPRTTPPLELKTSVMGGSAARRIVRHQLRTRSRPSTSRRSPITPRDHVRWFGASPVTWMKPTVLRSR